VNIKTRIGELERRQRQAAPGAPVLEIDRVRPDLCHPTGQPLRVRSVADVLATDSAVALLPAIERIWEP